MTVINGGGDKDNLEPLGPVSVRSHSAKWRDNAQRPKATLIDRPRFLIS